MRPSGICALDPASLHRDPLLRFELADTQWKSRRYPGGLYALYPAKLPPGGGALELGAGAVLSNSLLRRYRVRYDGARRVQALTLEEFRSPAQPGSR